MSRVPAEVMSTGVGTVLASKTKRSVLLPTLVLWNSPSNVHQHYVSRMSKNVLNSKPISPVLIMCLIDAIMENAKSTLKNVHLKYSVL